MNRYLTLLYIFCLCLVTGCYAFRDPKYNMSINFADPMPYNYTREITQAAYYAYQDLMDCNHLAIRDKVHMLERIEVRLAPSLLCKPEGGEACGCIIREMGPIIWINEDNWLFIEKKCSFYKTLCHELLHLAGLSHGSLMREAEWSCCNGY